MTISLCYNDATQNKHPLQKNLIWSLKINDWRPADPLIPVQAAAAAAGEERQLRVQSLRRPHGVRQRLLHPCINCCLCIKIGKGKQSFKCAVASDFLNFCITWATDSIIFIIRII